MKGSFGVDAKRDITEAVALHKAAEVLYLLRRGPVFIIFFSSFLSRIHSIERNKENVCASVRALGVCQSRNWEALRLDLWGEGLPRVPVQNNKQPVAASGLAGRDRGLEKPPTPTALLPPPPPPSQSGCSQPWESWTVSAYLVPVANYETMQEKESSKCPNVKKVCWFIIIIVIIIGVNVCRQVKVLVHICCVGSCMRVLCMFPYVRSV